MNILSKTRSLGVQKYQSWLNIYGCSLSV